MAWREKKDRAREREREQKWDGEQRERTKGQDSFVLTAYAETAVIERLALWKHFQAHQSKEPLHLQQPERQRDGHTRRLKSL